MAQTVKIGGATYENVPSISTTDGAGHAASFVDTSDADAAAGEILNGRKAYVNGAEVTGTMTNRGAVSGTISTKAGTYTVPAGYHNGSGKVQISASEQAKVIAGNIRSGVTLLGVAGASAVVNTSDADAAAGDIVSGKTAYVNGNKVTGSYVPPTGYQVATGSLVCNDESFTISGLPFKPVGCVLLLQSSPGKSYQYLNTSSKSAYVNPSTGDSIYGLRRNSSSFLILTGKIQLTNDGAKQTAANTGSSYGFRGTYLYVAWGN